MTDQTKSEGVDKNQAASIDHDVIVCIHNSLDDVRLCLETLVDLWSDEGLGRLILVDDASDAPTATLVEDFANAHDMIVRVRLEDQHYYTRAANAGLRASTATLRTLLNSDTVVTPGWARNIRRLFERDQNIGIAGPMSNAASTQSLPNVKSKDGQTAINQLPPLMSPARFAQTLATLAAGLQVPYVPVVHGFCYTIHEKVIDKIGYLDEETFPTGYGEENDYSFRTDDAGFALAIALNSFVFHAKSRSYTSDQQREFTQKGQAALAQKYSNRRIQNAIAVMDNQPVLVALRQRVREFWPEHDFLKVPNVETPVEIDTEHFDETPANEVAAR